MPETLPMFPDAQAELLALDHDVAELAANQWSEATRDRYDTPGVVSSHGVGREPCRPCRRTRTS